MKIESLKVGMTIKNYKTLCELLCIEAKKSGSNSYKAQFKELERYCKYHKEGRNIIIDEIYDEVKEKMDNRANNKGGNNNIYASDIELLILDMIYKLGSEAKYSGMIGYSKSYLYSKLGLVNDNYKPTKDKVLKLSDKLEIPYQSINECYNTTNGKLWNTVKSGLNSMRNRALINWDFSYNMIFEVDLNDGNKLEDAFRIADIADRELIRSCEHRALKTLNITTKTKVFNMKKWEQFKEIVTEYIKEVYPNLIYYYESVVIYFKYDEIKDSLYLLNSNNSAENIKKKLNGNISNGLSKTINNRHKNAKKNIEEKEIISKYDVYRTSENYVSEQIEIKDILINLDTDKIDFNFEYDGFKTLSLKHSWDNKNHTIYTKQLSLFSETDDSIEDLVDDSKGYDFIDNNYIPF